MSQRKNDNNITKFVFQIQLVLKKLIQLQSSEAFFPLFPFEIIKSGI